MGTRLMLSYEEKESIRNSHCSGKDGEHHVELCPVCARPELRMTHLNRISDVIVTVGEELCYVCRDFGSKHPETFNFIIRMLSGQRLIAKYQEE
jgi:hypothetical protein